MISDKVIYFSSPVSSWRLPIEWIGCYCFLLFCWNSFLQVPFPEDEFPNNISTNINIQSIFQFCPHWMPMYTEQKPVTSTQITLWFTYFLCFLWDFSKWFHDPKGSWRHNTYFLVVLQISFKIQLLFIAKAKELALWLKTFSDLHIINY